MQHHSPMDMKLCQRSMRCCTFSTSCTSFVSPATSTGPPACQLLLTASEPRLKSVAAAELPVLRAVTCAAAAHGAGSLSRLTAAEAAPGAVAVAVQVAAPRVEMAAPPVLLLPVVAAVGAGMTPGWKAAPACSCTSATRSASATALQDTPLHLLSRYSYACVACELLLKLKHADWPPVGPGNR